MPRLHDGARMPTPRRGADVPRCVSGDGCDHLAAHGSRFCDHHRDELRRIAAAIRAEAPRQT